MANSVALKTEYAFPGGKRMKYYRITHDTADTTTTIVPGVGFGYPVGCYSDYTVSSNTYSFTHIAGTATRYSWIMFFSL